MKITEYNHIFHPGQIALFPHITISLGYIDDLGNERDDAAIVFIGWMIYDFQFTISKRHSK